MHAAADGHPRIQVDHVGDAHADAAVRRARADRPLLGGAVDADRAVDAEPPRLERVVRRAAGDRLAGELTRSLDTLIGLFDALALVAVDRDRVDQSLVHRAL